MLSFLAAIAAAQTLPTVSTTTLSGRPVVVPDPDQDGRTVVLLAFARDHQDDLDAWRPHLVTLGCNWVEIPFIDVPWVLRRLIRGAMDRSIDDTVTRNHLAPVWGDADAVRRSVGIEEDDEIVVIVVDPRGRVLHRHDGPPGTTGPASLADALE